MWYDSIFTKLKKPAQLVFDLGVMIIVILGWQHQLNGHEFEQTLGDREGQGSLRVLVHGVAKSRT